MKNGPGRRGKQPDRWAQQSPPSCLPGPSEELSSPRNSRRL